MTEKTIRLLGEASRGNAVSAYQAALSLQEEGYGDVQVQAQLKRSAELGYFPAMRLLGLYGLCNRLVVEGSSVFNVVYNTSSSLGIMWIEKAMQCGDHVSGYIYGKCLQLGIGIEQNDALAEAVFQHIVPRLAFSEVIRFSMIVEAIPQLNRKPEIPAPESSDYVFPLVS